MKRRAAIAALCALGAGLAAPAGAQAGAADGLELPAPLPMGNSVKTGAALGAAVRPTIIVGDPALPTFPTGLTTIDPNTPDSPMAGTVAIYSAATPTSGVYGSGVAIDATHILTAAHVVDFAGGVGPGLAPTGDGVIDALMPYSRVYYNNTPAPDYLSISSIVTAPRWKGFQNLATGGGTHEDLAIITLSKPLPASVPTYPIYRKPFDQDFGQFILMTAYGQGGDAVTGVTAPATLQVKRYGWNIAAMYESNPVTGLGAEVWLSDFDAPDAQGDPTSAYTGLDGYPSLGNGFEANIAPGDSGGPAFLVDDLNHNGFVDTGELTVFGLTTVSFDTPDGSWPHFGSAFGGTILSAYAGFIDAAVPEPSTIALLAVGLATLTRRRRQDYRTRDCRLSR